MGPMRNGEKRVIRRQRDDCPVSVTVYRAAADTSYIILRNRKTDGEIWLTGDDAGELILRVQAALGILP